MALINCPECNKEVSDKSEVCIHCGYPIKTYLEEQDTEPSETGMNICPSCGKTWALTVCKDCGIKLINAHCTRDECFYMDEDTRRAWKKKLREKYVINSPYFNEEKYNQTLAHEEETYAFARQREQQQKNSPKCPTCGSTNISRIGTGEKVVSGAMWGLFSNKIHKTYKCNNCKYMW